MTLQEYNSNIWSFYLRLENDFINALNYVHFESDNFSTYSIEFERLLLSIGSEVDVLCKLLCKEIDSEQSPSKIFEYAPILSSIENFTSTKIRFVRTGLEVSPFSTLTPHASPSWWRAYNKVKHNRTENENYKQGNLENVFTALAALYMLNRYYCKQIACSALNNEPTPKSELFNVVGWQVSIPMGNGFFHVLRTDGSMGIMHE